MKHIVNLIIIIILPFSLVIPQEFHILKTGDIVFPINNSGILGYHNYENNQEYTYFQGKWILFSGGFFISGKKENELWCRAQAPSSLLDDWIPGKFGGDTPDILNRVYVVKKSDEPFGESWQNWKDAVILGADYYDGNNDGDYNPVDINGNNQWDLNEDRPDIIGDQTVWTVFNDNSLVDSRLPESNPVGLEIKQTVFAFDKPEKLNNVIFIRYRISKADSQSVFLDSVLFGAWTDPDIGDPGNDLSCSDIERNACMVYQNNNDTVYGAQTPCFAVALLAGPKKHIAGETYTDVNRNNHFDNGDIPIDTAIYSRGEFLGRKEVIGAKNQPISSFINYMSSDLTYGDPVTIEEGRNYMLGLKRNGISLNPCDNPISEVVGTDCLGIQTNFWFSGDPVENKGWLHTRAQDQRMLLNTGIFEIEGEEEIEIIFAYLVGQGNTPLESVTVTKELLEYLHKFYETNLTVEASTLTVNNKQVPSEFSLHQNYPNPFNPSTTISFELPGNSNVKLAVYNLLGEEVKVLVNSPLSAGTHKIEFNGSDLASGMYLYRLTTDRNTISKKAILLK